MDKKLKINSQSVNIIDQYYIDKVNNEQLYDIDKLKKIDIESWEYQSVNTYEWGKYNTIGPGVLLAQDEQPISKTSFYNLKKPNFNCYHAQLSPKIIDFIGMTTNKLIIKDCVGEDILNELSSFPILISAAFYTSFFQIIGIPSSASEASIRFFYDTAKDGVTDPYSGAITALYFDYISYDDFLTAPMDQLLGKPIFYDQYYYNDKNTLTVGMFGQLLTKDLYTYIYEMLIIKKAIKQNVPDEFFSSYIPSAQQKGYEVSTPLNCCWYYSLDESTLFPFTWFFLNSNPNLLVAERAAPKYLDTPILFSPLYINKEDSINTDNFSPGGWGNVKGYLEKNDDGDYKTDDDGNLIYTPKTPVGYEYVSAEESEDGRNLLILQYKGTYSCLSGDTIISIKNEKKRIDEIDIEKDFIENEKIIYSDAKLYKKASKYIIYEFSDGTTLKVIRDHRIWSEKRRRFCHISSFKLGEETVNEKGERISLISKTLKKEPIYHYTLFTNDTNKYYANGILCGNIFSNIRIGWLRKLVIKMFIKFNEKGRRNRK